MKSILRLFCLAFSLFISISINWAQETTNSHKVFLLGNFSDIPSEQNFTDHLDQLLANEEGDFTPNPYWGYHQ